MAQKGLKAMVTLNGEKILDDVVQAFHQACHKHGRNGQLGQDMIWGAGIYLADTEKRRSAASNRRMTSATNGSRRSASCATPTSTAAPGAPPARPRQCRPCAKGVKQKAWFCGPPCLVCIDGIKSIEAKYPGLEDFMIHWAEGLPPAESSSNSAGSPARSCPLQPRLTTEPAWLAARG